MVYRIVEQHTQLANSAIVDSLDELGVLESLLAGMRPIDANDETSAYHLLLRAPFRDSPLKYGSRFGTQQHPGIFYGASEIKGALTEHAYYRFIFANSMTGKWPSNSLLSSHSVFSVAYDTQAGIWLNHLPFSQYQNQLCDPLYYETTQAIGVHMRDANVDLFTFTSARDLTQECVGVFTPKAFTSTHPNTIDTWLCELTPTQVQYKQVNAFTMIKIEQSQFLIDGVLPKPAH